MTMPRHEPRAWLARRESPSFYLFLLFILWTAGAGTSLFFTISHMYSMAKNTAVVQARTSFQKDILYRRWSSGLGGVYVTVTPKTQPNPYLVVPWRDIPGPGNTTLTKLNPAYMTRLVHELGEMESGLRGRIISMRPIRPDNAPDPWEEKALVSFETGRQVEVAEVVTMDGEERLRYIAPLVTERDCLSCHAFQGYQLGQVRGGISVSIPMAPIAESARQTVMVVLFSHIIIWLLGCILLLLCARRIRRCICEEDSNNCR